MFVNALQLAVINYFFLSMGTGYFQINELYTRKLESTTTYLHTTKQNYKSLIVVKNNNKLIF